MLVTLNKSQYLGMYTYIYIYILHNINLISVIVSHVIKFNSKIQVDSVVSPTLVSTTTPARTVTKYSRRKGKRKSVKAVLDRFYRLNW